jgi:Flp pilus assembly protein TadB
MKGVGEMSISLIQAVISLAQFAPFISKWVGSSKIEQVANIVVEVAKRITNTKTESDAIEKLKHDSNLILSFQKALLDSEREIELAIIKDKESARSRDIAIINSGRRNKRADIMVISAAIGLILCLLSITLYQEHLPGEAVGIISTIAGIFGACLKDAYNFEFGSSRGSKEKDQTVASILNKM